MNGNAGAGALGRRLGIIVLWALCLGGLTVASVSHVLAHASLVRVEPADGSVIKAAPQSFKLVFSEPTSPLVLKLVYPDGTAVDLDRFVLRDAALDIEAPPGLGNGTHVLTWRIVSEDGHPVGGSAVFSIGAPGVVGAAPAASAAGAVDWPVRGAIWIAKIMLYAGLFIGVGGSFFINWIGGRTPPERFPIKWNHSIDKNSLTIKEPDHSSASLNVRNDPATRVAFLSLFAGLVATPLSVGLQGLDALGEPLSSLATAQVWAAGFSTSYGLTALVASGAFVSAAAALAVAGIVPGRVLALLAYLAVGVALAASGHASAARPQWLTRPAVFLHGIGIAFWAGSLVPLWAAFVSAPAQAGAALLQRFSRVIPFAVLILVVAGVGLAAVQLRSVDALWTTDYGRLLLIKLVLLALLFLLAAVNRFRLTGPALRGDGAAVRQLRRSIRLELILVLAIFAVASGWRFTPPPRSTAEAADVPVLVHIHADKAMADLTITPGRAGPVHASVVILTGDFAPLDAKEITLALSNAAAGIEPIKRAATRSADGTWSVDGLNLPLPGPWRVRVDVLISDFELVKLEETVVIRP